MPEYTYDCLREFGGCGHTFTIFSTIAEYNSNFQPVCPQCKQSQWSVRNFSGIRISTGIHTVGALADKNTNSLSKDAKNTLNKQHNEYKIPNKTLPDGMKRIRETGIDIKHHKEKKKKIQ